MILTRSAVALCTVLSLASCGVTYTPQTVSTKDTPLNVAFFVRHEYFLHPKSGNLQEVSQESVHIYNLMGGGVVSGCED
jgi:hypothetical protein